MVQWIENNVLPPRSRRDAGGATQAAQVAEPAAVPKACSLDDPDCEACQ